MKIKKNHQEVIIFIKKNTIRKEKRIQKSNPVFKDLKPLPLSIYYTCWCI